LIGAERRAQPVTGLLRMLKEAGLTAPAISVITVMEFSHGIWRANTPELEQTRRIYVQEVFAAIPVEPFTKDMAERAARIDAESRKTGKVIPLADLQIGVTALELGFAVATHNRRHFSMIPGLNVMAL
jgi:predicted nucleic acid-binding protein